MSHTFKVNPETLEEERERHLMRYDGQTYKVGPRTQKALSHIKRHNRRVTRYGQEHELDKELNESN